MKVGAAHGLGAEGGFTLIEALVALAIGGLVIAVIATITGQWMRSWRYGFPTLQRSELLVASLDRMAADLAAARFFPAVVGGTGVMFRGDETSVTLVRRSLPVEMPAGLETVRLAPPVGSSDVTLVRSRALLPFGAGIAPPVDAAPVVLLRPPFAIRFAYADAGRQWRATWEAIGRTPRLVRISVIDRRSGQDVMPPIEVRVRVEAPGSCATVLSATLCDVAMGTAVLAPSVVPGDKAGPL